MVALIGLQGALMTWHIGVSDVGLVRQVAESKGPKSIVVVSWVVVGALRIDYGAGDRRLATREILNTQART